MDLTLLPLQGSDELGKNSVLTYERLEVRPADGRIFTQLTTRLGGEKPTIESQALPPQMQVEVYEDDGLRSTRKDVHNELLRFVYARDFKKLELPEDASSHNRAIKAFVDALPDRIPIILYWQ